MEEAKGVYLHIQNLEKKVDDLGDELVENPNDLDLKDKEVNARFTLASSYVIVGEYEKAISHLNQIRERIPPVEERSAVEDGLYAVVIGTLFDIHLQRKADESDYTPKENYEALAVGAGLFTGEIHKPPTTINLLKAYLNEQKD